MMVTDIRSARSKEIIKRCRNIASMTDIPGETTRTFLSPAARQVQSLVREWMERAGMVVRVDAVGNLRGMYAGLNAEAPLLIVGSHLDTVPNAGAFDGVLGVVLGIGLVQELGGERLPFAIEVIGFSEEEGIRFSKPFLGSMALTGALDSATLELQDAGGVSVCDAIRGFGLNPAEMVAAEVSSRAFAYFEMHIEQGPVLESMGRSLGTVEAVVGQSRFAISFTGKANHAGTTPMELRQDAMTGAAEWILAVEDMALAQGGLVATVGQVSASPGAANVIAGEVSLTLDIRHADDAVRTAAVERILLAGTALADRRGLSFGWSQTMEQSTVALDTSLVALLCAAVERTDLPAVPMVSGAGHDAMMVAARLPSCMLFLRSPGGLSHHPDESVLVQDVEAALIAGGHFLHLLSEKMFQMER